MESTRVVGVQGLCMGVKSMDHMSKMSLIKNCFQGK